MKKMKNIVAILLLITFTGCVPMAFLGGALVGVGGYKYYEGNLTVIYQAPYAKTFDSSVKALETLGYNIAEKRQKMASGKITTTGTASKRIKISVEYMSSEETKVKIHVGILGDENVSNIIKDKISDIVFNKNGSGADV